MRRIVLFAFGFIFGIFGFLAVLDKFDLGFQAGMRAAIDDYHEIISERIGRTVAEVSPDVAVFALESYIESLELELNLGDSETRRSEMLADAREELARQKKRMRAGDENDVAEKKAGVVVRRGLLELENEEDAESNKAVVE